MSSGKQRGSMSRKRPTQVELERENSELKKQVQQLQKRLKQTMRQLKNHEDIQLDNEITLDLEQEAAFQDLLAGEKPTDESEKFIVLQLPNGQIKRIPKRVSNE